MTPEQQHWHQLMMSPQIENVELAFQFLESGAIEINLKPYKSFIFIQTSLACNFGFEAHLDMLWNAYYFHHCLQSARERIGVRVPACNGTSLLFKYPCTMSIGLRYDLYDKIETDVIIVSNSLTKLILIEYIKYAKEIVVYDFLEILEAYNCEFNFLQHIIDLNPKSISLRSDELPSPENLFAPNPPRVIDPAHFLGLKHAILSLKIKEDREIEISEHIYKILKSIAPNGSFLFTIYQRSFNQKNIPLIDSKPKHYLNLIKNC